MSRPARERAAFEARLRRRMSRRALIAASVAISLRGVPTHALGSTPTHRPLRRYQGTANPFTLGVASGDPLPDGVVLWTRLAPDPLGDELGGMPNEPVDVRWELAADDQFSRIVASGSIVTDPAFAHSVHIDIEGLEANRFYWYRFLAGSALSPVGRTKTAPMAGAALDQARFGFASCANWEHGWFTAYRGIAAEEIDALLFLGDYFYEYPAGLDYRGQSGEPVRLHHGETCLTLADYRLRHAQYKTDSDLQAAHLAHPWIATWDDHEVARNYANDQDDLGTPPDVFLERRAAAYQAYYEHMPIRPQSLPNGPDFPIYRRLSWGDLATISVLDTRQYRSAPPCGDVVGNRCDASLDPALTMTGPEQESWLIDGLVSSGSRWNVIAQQIMMAELDLKPFDDDTILDGFWDGYPAARARLLGAVQEASVPNAIVLSGDVHCAWANDLKADFLADDSPVVASEFVTTSITALNPYGALVGAARLINPHLRYFDTRHGYSLIDVTPDRWQTTYRALEDPTDPEGIPETIARWVVENGNAGVQEG